MNWYLWYLVAYFGAGAVLAVAYVGKRREPITPGVAAAMVVLYAAQIAGVFLWGAQ